MKDDIVNIPEHPGGAGLTEDKVPNTDPVLINNGDWRNYVQLGTMYITVDKPGTADPSMISNEDWKNYKPNGPQEVQLETHGETAQDPLVQFNNNMHPTNDLTGVVTGMGKPCPPDGGTGKMTPNTDPTLVGSDWNNNGSSYSDAHEKQKRIFQREITQLKVAPKRSKTLKPGIPIFIGASDHKCDKIQEKILAYTLQKNSAAKLDITFLRASMFPGVSAMGWGTPFTGLRYVIPKLMGFKGKAIYMDMDMINFRDIEDFYNINLYGKPFGMVWDTKFNGHGGYCDSMLLMDCSKTNEFFTWEEAHDYYEKKCGFKWVFAERVNKYEDKDKPMQNEAVVRLDSRWNCFDGDITDGILSNDGKLPRYDLDQIFQLHLTALSYQPWHSSYLMSAKATHMRPDVSDYWWELVDEVNSLEF